MRLKEITGLYIRIILIILIHRIPFTSELKKNGTPTHVKSWEVIESPAMLG